mmetsp:Transcript_11730/g.41403  ORF Transcript_11730/g.41403 Transcript_11730/m.41403 type:complete len:104 (+) Transcript_11730:393-704(+)
MRAADDRFEALLEVATDRTGSATPAAPPPCAPPAWAPPAAPQRSAAPKQGALPLFPPPLCPAPPMPDLADGMGDLLAAWYYCGYYTGRYMAAQEHRQQMPPRL